MATPAHLRARVRALYKQILFVGRDYPAGLAVVRRRAKEEFLRHRFGGERQRGRKALTPSRHETDPTQIGLLLARGRWYLKELEATCAMHKYRTLRRRYTDQHQ